MAEGRHCRLCVVCPDLGMWSSDPLWIWVGRRSGRADDMRAMLQIRCIYRVAEFAEGVEGYAFRHEWLFWVFESAPMLVAIIVFCFSHPGAYLGRGGWERRTGGKGGESGESEEMASRPRHGRRNDRLAR